jgi:predicted DNA-binding protein (UPF0251 family)
MQTLRRPPTKPRKRAAYDQELMRREDEAFRLATDHGFDDETVGAKMGVSGRQARTYISRARNRKVEALRRAMGVEGGYQIYSSLAYAASEARAAWEASKEAVVREEVFIGKNDSGEGCSERIKQIITKKGPNPAYLASFIQANLAMVNLLGLNPSELQRSSELATNVDSTVEDLKSLSTEELLIRYRKTIGIA